MLASQVQGGEAAHIFHGSDGAGGEEHREGSEKGATNYLSKAPLKTFGEA